MKRIRRAVWRESSHRSFSQRRPVVLHQRPRLRRPDHSGPQRPARQPGPRHPGLRHRDHEAAAQVSRPGHRPDHDDLLHDWRPRLPHHQPRDRVRRRGRLWLLAEARVSRPLCHLQWGRRKVLAQKVDKSNRNFDYLDYYYYPGFKSYKILLNKFENPSTHSSQDLMEILDTILQSKLKFSFILLMILVFYNIILISFLHFSYK